MDRRSEKSTQKTTQRTGDPLVKWLLVITLLTPILLGILLSWHSLSGFDVWLHQRVGQDIIAGEGFPHTNTYSYIAQNQPWLNHEWLFQVTIAALGSTSSIQPNPLAWNIFRTFIVTVFLIFLLFGDLPRRGFATIMHQSWITWLGLPFLVGIHNLWPRLILRPELFSYLAIVILIRQMELLAKQTNTTRDNHKILLGIFGLTILWCQLHGFSAMAPAITLLALLATAISQFIGLASLPKVSWANLGLALAVTLLAQILTPNGLAGLLYPFKALGQFQDPSADIANSITELVPLLSTKAALGRTLILFKLSMVWAVLWIILNWGKINFFRIMFWAITAAAALQMQRSIGLYAIAFILLHTYQLGRGHSLRFISRFKFPQGRAIALTGTALSLLLGTLWSIEVVNDRFYLEEGTSRRFGTGVTPALYPETIAQSLAAEGNQKVLANIDAAGYLLANSSVQLFIDGRTEAYEPHYWSQYNALQAASDRSFQVIQDLAPNTIVLSIGGGAFLKLARALVNSTSWQVSGLDEAALSFIPADKDLKPGDNIRWLQNHIVPLESTVKNRTATPTRLADHYLALARLWLLANNSQATERCYKKGLATSPNHPVLLYNYGNLLRKQNNYVPALEHFQKALTNNSRLATSAINAGECLMQLKKIPEAEKMFQRGVAIDKSNFNGWANLGVSRIHQGKNKSALKALEKALLLRPENRNIIDMIQNLKKQG